MTIPIEIVAVILAFLLTALLGSQLSLRKRIDSLEKNVLVIIVMLRDRGLQIPTSDSVSKIKL